MSKDFGQGIFEMPFITQIMSMNDLVGAKSLAQSVIDQSTANDKNKAKASLLVSKARNINGLGRDMVNFSLSHQGLKTIR